MLRVEMQLGFANREHCSWRNVPEEVRPQDKQIIGTKMQQLSMIPFNKGHGPSAVTNHSNPRPPAGAMG